MVGQLGMDSCVELISNEGRCPGRDVGGDQDGVDEPDLHLETGRLIVEGVRQQGSAPDGRARLSQDCPSEPSRQGQAYGSRLDRMEVAVGHG